MKKLYLLLFSTFFAVALSIALLGAEKPALKTTAGFQTFDNYLIDNGYISISQEDKTYKKSSDFLTYQDGYDTYNAIYTNKTVTLTLKSPPSSYLDGFNFNVTKHTSAGSETLSDAGSNSIIDDAATLNTEEKGLTKREVFTKRFGKYSNFVSRENNVDRTYHQFSFSTTKLTEDTKYHIHILYSLNNGKRYDLNLIIIQTQTDFVVNSGISWNYEKDFQSLNVTAPTNGQTYPILNLNLPQTGTELNPIYVRFTYLGEVFTVYKIGKNLYNSFDNKLIKNPTITNDQNDNNVTFMQSGTYTVEIYDKTSLKGSSQNYLKYNFTVVNTTSNSSKFYIHTHHNNAEKTLVANGQVSNQDVVVDFVNLNSIISNVGSINVTKSYKPSVGENISEVTEYTKNIPSTLTFNKDGTYNITVLNKSGNEIKMYEFIIIKTFRSYFEYEGKVYEIGANEPKNTFKTETFTSTKYSTYNMSQTLNYNDAKIESKNSYNFNVTIAKSDPSISGIGNHGKKAGKLTLTIYGVGKINVEVTHDGGEPITYTVENGEKLPKLTEAGKYNVKITDEMGTTITKSFTLTVKRNTAAKLVIILGIGLAAVIGLVIMLKRGKVRVR